MSTGLTVNAVVLAGRSNEGVFKEVSQASNEALIMIGDRTMLDYVLAALASASSVDRVAVVGTSEVKDRLPEGVDYVPAAGDVIDNVVRGAQHLGDDRPLLVVTSDIPFITGEIVDRFVAQCAAKPADLYYPAIPKQAAEEKYPGVHRTYAKLAEGTFTGGNIFLVAPDVVREHSGKVKAFVEARKSPAKMAAIIGPAFAIKLALGMLSARELEVKISKMFGMRGAVIVTNDAEIGVDVDKLSDLELAQRVLAR